MNKFLHPLLSTEWVFRDWGRSENLEKWREKDIFPARFVRDCVCLFFPSRVCVAWCVLCVCVCARCFFSPENVRLIRCRQCRLHYPHPSHLLHLLHIILVRIHHVLRDVSTVAVSPVVQWRQNAQGRARKRFGWRWRRRRRRWRDGQTFLGRRGRHHL